MFKKIHNVIYFSDVCNTIPVNYIYTVQGTTCVHNVILKEGSKFCLNF